MSTADYQPLQGMSDLDPPEIYLWQMIEGTARNLLQRFGYEEVRTPIVERTDLFVRSIGDTTEVVQKEMYTFEDRGGRSLSLRPEGTAGVIRHIAGGGPEALQARLYYMGPMFRAERPQAGRRRQFHQIGVECLGEANAAVDAECIAMQHDLLREWGLEGFSIQVNTRGMPQDREVVAKGLVEQLLPMKDKLCEDCVRRLDSNVLRVLDCKQEVCRMIVDNLPPVTSFMSQEARDYLGEVERLLTMLDVPFEINPTLVRGLDYYVHTVWEITHPALGAQDAIAGGGRYVIDLGDKQIPGVGFGMGLERIVTCLKETTRPSDVAPRPKVWIVSQGDRAFDENIILAMTLRRRGVTCKMDLERRSMKAQMRAAGKSGASYVVIRGDHEMEQGTFQVKRLEDGGQQEMDMPALLELLSPVHTV